MLLYISILGIPRNSSGPVWTCLGTLSGPVCLQVVTLSGRTLYQTVTTCLGFPPYVSDPVLDPACLDPAWTLPLDQSAWTLSV